MGGRAHHVHPQLLFLRAVVSSQGEIQLRTGAGLRLNLEFPLFKHDQCDVQCLLLTCLACGSGVTQVAVSSF